MERSRHASHLASRSYRGGIPDLGGGEEGAGAGDGAGAGAALSGNSAMARERVSGHEEREEPTNGDGKGAAWTGKAFGWGCLRRSSLRTGAGFDARMPCAGMGWEGAGLIYKIWFLTVIYKIWFLNKN
jgi:hypothetical protein